MDEQDKKDTVAEPTTAPVMDVQPPNQEPGDTTPEQVDLSDPLADEGDAVASEPAVPPPGDEAKAEESSPEKPAADTGAPDPVKQPELPAPKKHTGPVIIIVIAIVVAAALAIAAVFAFTKDKKAADNTTPESTTQQPLTPEQEIDTTTSEIDSSLDSIDETTDFPDNELTDETLGL